MANNGKFLNITGGVPKQESAATSSSGSDDAGKIIGLDGSGRIDPSMMPVGISADVGTITASEDLAAGALVNVYNASGSKARNADATAAGKAAVGFVLAAVTSGQSATVYFEGSITGLSGLTPGARQFLSTTAGGHTETAPSTSGNVNQMIGVAVSTTVISFEPGDAIELA